MSSNPLSGEGSLADFGRRTPTVAMKRFAVPAEAVREVEDDQIPSSFGRFVVHGELGRGAMGRVLDAFDPDLERTVALKVVPIDDRNPAMRERLLSEARIASQLEHPNIVPVYEMGSMEGWLYFAMRRISGRTLADVLRGKARDEEWARGWTRRRLISSFMALSRAVGHAHSRGVLHQDLKPSNVMLGTLGEVQLLDWGIARSVSPEDDVASLADADKTADPDAPDHHGRVWGTPGYMSPERIRGEDGALDPRADIWALGVILYELVTLRRGFVAKTPMAVLMKILKGPQKDPRAATVREPVPDELAEIVMTATSESLDDRFASVEDLVRALEGFLDGSRRRQRAAEHLADARMLWAEHEAMAGERQRLYESEKAEEVRVPAWAPLAEKGELFRLRRELSDLEPKRASLFARAIGAADRALTEDPQHVLARRFLAGAFWGRYLEAEASRDRADQTYFLARVEEWDDGSLAEVRAGRGTLTLRTDPPDAEVLCARYDRDGLLYELGERVPLGQTPLVKVPMEMGSYLLTLRSPGRDDVSYPVLITRDMSWDSGRAPVRLPARGEVADGFAYVPGGPYNAGGDPEAQDGRPAARVSVPAFAMGRDPIQMWEYCEFINGLHARDPDAAWARVPRYESGLDVNAGQYWARPEPGGRYVVPEVDRDGDPWEPTWPVMGIHWDDAVAYAEWRSERDGRRYALPTEDQWEKAARGADGRVFPWGDGFDPSLCHMRLSRETRPQPLPVGTFATDCSVYGMRDVSGGVRDWCAGTGYGGFAARRAVRGGSWDSHQRYCRITHRTGYLRGYLAMSFGMRLVQVGFEDAGGGDRD